MDKNKLLTVIVLLLMIYLYYFRGKITENFVSMKTLYTKAAKPYTTDRLQNCLTTYPTYDNLKFKPMKTKYWNKYFKQHMDLRLCDFYIAGSYKSYTVCGYTKDIQSYEGIKRALLMGARALTLDLYSNDSIDNRQIEVRVENVLNSVQGKPLDFEKVCQVINSYGWLNVNYPLIVYFNINFDDRLLYQKMAKIFVNVFKDRLAHKKYGFKRFNLAQAPVKDLMGTILIILNKYPTDGLLNEVTHGAISDKHQTITMKEFSDGNMNYGGVKATETDLLYLINYNKFNMSWYYHSPKDQMDNVLVLKNDIENYDASDPRKYGAQICFMYYQKNDDAMKEYLDFFSECSFILKPDALRYIPQPKKPIKKQDKRLYYTPNKHVFSGMNGHPWIKLTY